MADGHWLNRNTLYLSEGLTNRQLLHGDDKGPMNLTLPPYTTLTILQNKTAKIIKTKTVFSFSAFVKATALKYQISKSLPQILSA